MIQIVKFSRDGTKVTLIPFYGGGKGQSLQIVETPDGQVMTTIVKTPENAVTQNYITTVEVENPPLPNKQEIIKTYEEARNLGEEMEIPDDELEHESREGLSEWFSRKKNNKKEKEDKKKKKEEEEEEKRKKEEEEKKKEQEKEKEENKEEEGDDDTVAINLPPEDASVAEAKPFGIAIAGEGGVAASKPVGAAVVGPGGLAVARPVGTAIAGIPPEKVPILGGGAKKGGEKSSFVGKLIAKYSEE